MKVTHVKENRKQWMGERILCGQNAHVDIFVSCNINTHFSFDVFMQ
jgi:hypothetical protein